MKLNKKKSTLILSILLSYTITVKAENTNFTSSHLSSIDSHYTSLLKETEIVQQSEANSKYTLTFLPSSNGNQEINVSLEVNHLKIGCSFQNNSLEFCGGIVDKTTPIEDVTLTAGIFPITYSFDKNIRTFPMDISCGIRLGPKSMGITLSGSSSIYSVRNITPMVSLDVALGTNGTVFIQTNLVKWQPTKVQLGFNLIP